MALQASGAISLADIQGEFGGSNPIGLNEYYSAAAGIPASGVISIGDFYGASASSPFSVFNAVNVESGSADGYSLYSTKSTTSQIVFGTAGAAGVAIRVMMNTYGVFVYVKEQYTNATSYYYTPANVQTAMTTSEVLAASTNAYTSTSVTAMMLDWSYTTTSSGAFGALGDTTNSSATYNPLDGVWQAVTANQSVGRAFYVRPTAECYETSYKRVYGSVDIWLRGPGKTDTLVHSLDFDVNATATSTNCY
jgi:hypothetical protein